MIVRVMAAMAVLVATSAVALADDVDNVYRLGEALKNAGVATDYDVSGWGATLDVHIGSMLPGDARSVANGACEFGRQNMKWQKPWTVQVFLVVGERPAATCTVR